MRASRVRTQYGHSHGKEVFLLELFPSTYLATNLLERLDLTLKRYAERRDRVALGPARETLLQWRLN
jgi:hypothetical protein